MRISLSSPSLDFNPSRCTKVSNVGPFALYRDRTQYEGVYHLVSKGLAIGHCGLYFINGIFFLDNVFLESAYRGKNIFSQMLPVVLSDFNKFPVLVESPDYMVNIYRSTGFEHATKDDLIKYKHELHLHRRDVIFEAGKTYSLMIRRG